MSELAPGAVLAGYRIEGLIGQGGMGAVYRATQLALDRQVALKVIAGPAAFDAVFRDRFRREAMAAAAVDHPHVLPVFEAGDQDGTLFLSMRLVEGETLADRLRRDVRLEPATALALAGQVAAALDAAHARGVVHRDVKPGNVLIAAGEHAYLADFGIARLAGRSALTETGVVVGTLGYVAPEVLRGAPADARSDTYALGCLLYETLTGTVPFPRESDVAALTAHLFDPVPSLGDRAPAQLEALVRSMLAKRPADRPLELAAAVRAAAAGDQPAVAVRTSLPRAPARLVGRERALRDLLAACAGEERLVTLTGPAGVGKTELALAAAETLAADLPDGVSWVGLEALAHAAEVVPAIARGLALGDEPGVAPIDRVIAHVRARRMLVVLDNFEHVLGAAADLTRILAGAPALRLLVTSQSPLRLRDERLVVLRPLELPDPGAAGVSPAVQMLLQRAPDLALTPDNADAIAELCRRLDGLPLALELAAARLHLLEPAELVARLDQSLDTLGRGRRDAPDRHRGMRAAFDWTTAQLETTDRALLERLAVFGGGFTISLAEAAGDGDAVSGLAALLEVSLIRRGEHGRLSMPPPVRVYALERLRTAGLETTALERHAAALLQLAQSLDWIRDMVGSMRTFRGDQDNFRQALRWSRAARPATHARLVAAIGLLLGHAGHEVELADEAEAALERTREPALRARLLYMRAFALEGAGDAAPYVMAVAACRDAGEDLALIGALFGLSIVYATRGDGELALAAAVEAQTLSERRGDSAYHDAATVVVGQALRVRGEVDEALATLRAVEARARPDTAAAVYASASLADAALAGGDATGALVRYARCLRVFHELGMMPNAALQLDGACLALTLLGRHEEALTAAAVGDRIRHEFSIVASREWQQAREDALSPAVEAVAPAAAEASRARARSMDVPRAVAWLEALADAERTSSSSGLG